MQEMIRVSGLRKQYRLGAIGGRTLQESLQSWWALKNGREDPNQRIGAPVGNKPFWALDGIDLAVQKGERLGIIGANGAGKSTLLKILSRVTAPTEGEVDLYGRVSSLLEVGTGFHGEMTGRENIYMNGSILGMRKEEIDARLEDIIAFSEVGDFVDTPVKRYSSGMIVKLAFAVAAHLNSEIMIMDEVLAVGDMAFQHKCLDKMNEAAETEGRTILYVSHNMNTIRRLCDRCIVLDAGKKIFDGDTEQAIALYMDHSLGESGTDMDLDSKSHTGPDSGVRMLRLLLPDKVTPVYEPGEDLRLRLRVRSDKTANVRFRLTLRTDTDTGLATAWSDERPLTPGDQELSFTLPLRQLAKGVFYVSIGLYRNDEIGQPFLLDHITRAFKIELPGLPIWNTNAHGYMKLDFE